MKFYDSPLFSCLLLGEQSMTQREAKRYLMGDFLRARMDLSVTRDIW